MDDVKIANCRKQHPGVAFPVYRRLSPDEAAKVRSHLARMLRIGEPLYLQDFTRQVLSRSRRILGLDAGSRKPDLLEILNPLGVKADQLVLLNWYRFDRVDEIRLADLATWFDDLWYPAVDDVDVFDSSCKWM